MNRKKIKSITGATLLCTSLVSISGQMLSTPKIVNALESNILRSSKTGQVVNVKQGSNLNIRQAANTNSTVIGRLSYNDTFSIIGESGNWYQIQKGNTKGYVNKNYVKIITPSVNPETNVPDTEVVSKKGQVINVKQGSSLNIRKSSTTSSTVVGKLTYNDTFSIIGETGNWYHIEKGSIKGYVSKDYVKVISTTTPEENNPVVPEAKPEVNNATGKIITYDLNIRKDMSYSAEILGLVKVGQTVEILESKNGWTKIKYNNITGYVLSTYVKLNASSDKPNTTPETNPDTTPEQNRPVAPETKPEESKPEANNTTGKIITYDLNIRKDMSYSAEVLGLVKVGETVDVLESRNGWTKIRYNNITGYVLSTYVKLNASSDIPNNTPEVNPDTTPEQNKPVVPDTKPEENPEKPTGNKKGVVYNVSSSLNVREKSSISSSILGKLYPNSHVTIIDEENDWYKIEFNSSYGYVNKSYIKLIKEDETLTDEAALEIYNKIFEAMNAQVGTPYLYGGSGELITPESLSALKKRFPSNASRGDYDLDSKWINNGYRAFDCSGFIQWGFKQAGITLPRTTKEQINSGYEVSINNLKPGDLLFYSDLSHVAMYIGNNQMIESPRTGDFVKIGPVLWSKITRARRIIN